MRVCRPHVTRNLRAILERSRADVGRRRLPNQGRGGSRVQPPQTHRKVGPPDKRLRDRTPPYRDRIIRSDASVLFRSIANSSDQTTKCPKAVEFRPRRRPRRHMRPHSRPRRLCVRMWPLSMHAMPDLINSKTHRHRVWRWARSHPHATNGLAEWSTPGGSSQTQLKVHLQLFFIEATNFIEKK